jgi:hypothetical protein
VKIFGFEIHFLMLFLWTVFSKSGWKLIPLNFAYNDAIAGRTWKDLYNKTNGKICSKFGMFPIRENGQDYIEWYCVETVGEYITEPIITAPQYNETRMATLESQNQEMSARIEYLEGLHKKDLLLKNTQESKIEELEQRIKYLYEKVLDIEWRPYIKPLSNIFLKTD